MALTGIGIKVSEVKNVNDAMLYILEGHLATLELLADKAAPTRCELERAIELGQASVKWANEFGLNLENTRAEVIRKEFNSNVKAWATHLLANKRPRHKYGVSKH
ncbi:MAG: hypothetical protein ACTS9Y_01235 [Methylophilus sp.]|uniref:hypothetical protein n=1 Tax=Methylophilus sp. TaxID=29541 RepID=UPI003F9F5174